jgi:pimeloyl-ACP methyl ester carboxylesterase
LHRQVKGSILKEIPRAYHHMPLDNPDATAAAMIDFIESRRSGRQIQTPRSAQH